MLQYQLVYYSEASRDFSADDLIDLLKVSIKNNTAAGITGCLLYGNRKFIQLLEGPREEVLKLYERISNDKRHVNIMKVTEMSVNEKLFPKWAMGFHKMDNDPDIPDDGWVDPSKWIYSEFVANASPAKEKVFNFAVRQGLMESQVLPK